MAEDIHKIWKLWGAGGLIDKIGPHRTIRELKKRCDAGAVIGCSLYKLLIEKWMDTAMNMVDPGARGPAYDFIEAAGEGELILKIEALHKQYPPKLSLIKEKEELVSGIPLDVRFDFKDEWNAALERKIGRKIPMDPRDASKKDIEDSKKVVELLAAGEGLPRPLKPKFVPEKEEVPPPVKPAERPRAAAPEEVPSRPLIVKGPPELELMKKEIEDKISEEKRRRARGGGMAGEPVGEYKHNITPKSLNRKEIAHLSKDIEDNCVALGYVNLYSLFPKSRFGTDTGILYDCRNVDSSKLKRDTIARGESDIIIATSSKPYRIKTYPDLKEIIIGEQAGRHDFVVDPRAKFAVENVYSQWTYDDFKIVINRTTDIETLMDLAKHIEDSTVMTPGDKESARQLVEKRKRLIESGAPEIKKQAEQLEAEGRLAKIERQEPKVREDDKKKDDDVMQEPRDYTQWTFADFEGLIPGLEDPEDLEELQEYIDASDKLTESEAETLRKTIQERIKEVEKTGS